MNYIFTESKREEIRYTYENGKIKQVTILYKGNNDGDNRIFELLKTAQEYVNNQGQTL